MYAKVKDFLFPTESLDRSQSDLTVMKPIAPVGNEKAKPLQLKQTIKFLGTDDQYSTAVVSDDVLIIPSLGTHKNGSSKVKTENIVDHCWDVRTHNRQLLAVHIGGKFIAFGLQVLGKSDNMVSVNAKSEGMVRIVNRQNNHRYLCKGMTGLIQDISFAHIPTEVLLGLVDEAGNLFVYKIIDQTSNLDAALLLYVTRPAESTTAPVTRRLIWCPYIPEDDECDVSKDSDYDDVTNMLVVTHGPVAELWSTSLVVAKYGEGKELQSANVKEGLLILHEHTQDIVEATFSPDGTALATASLDGFVKFYQEENGLPLVNTETKKVNIHLTLLRKAGSYAQVRLTTGHDQTQQHADVAGDKSNLSIYMHNNDNKPRCLHNWQPHNGKPLSSLFFLDNHRNFNPDIQFWRYAVTGAENNSELKIWSCETWSCLQTIKFEPHPLSSQTSLCLKAGLDLSSEFLLLSDITNRVLYVLQLHIDLKEASAFVCAITELLLPNAVISFGIVDAGIRYVKEHDDVQTDILDTNGEPAEDEDDEKALQVVLRMYVVQPKSLQTCSISFDPPKEANKTLSRLSQDPLIFRDNLSDVLDETSEAQAPLPISREMTSNHLHQLSLMTPDDFSSATIKLEVQPESAVATSEVVEREEHHPGSGDSSPSREVEEILSLGSSERLTGTMLMASQSLSEEKSPAQLLPAKMASPQERDQLAEAAASLKLDLNLEMPVLAQDNPNRSSASSTTANISPDPVNVSGYKSPPLVRTGNDPSVNMDMCAARVSLDKMINKPPVTDSGVTQSVLDKVDLLISMVQQQQSEIKMIKQQVAVLSASSSNSQKNVQTNQLEAQLRSNQQHLESGLCAAVRNAISANHHEAVQRLDLREQQRQEAVVAAVVRAVSQNLTVQLPNIITQDIKDRLTSMVRNTLNQIKQEANADIASKLTATDQLMKENIANLVSNNAVMEMLGQSIVSLAQPAMQNLYKESFASLVPTMEKITQNMFHQINNSFSRGTQEYMQYVDSNLEKQRRHADRAQEMLVQMRSLAETMQTAHKVQANLLKEAMDQQMKKMTESQDRLNKILSDTVKGNLAQGFQAQKAVIEESVLTSLNAVRSCAVSPTPSVVDPQVTERQIVQHLNDGDINGAFQQALSAANINLVLMVCKRVNPESLHSQTPCPLKQNILLSLIQQLSLDLNDHTELKRRYLEVAFVNLDHTDPDVLKHMYIIAKLKSQLFAYMRENPSSPSTLSMKMLWLAIQSVPSVPNDK